jgi:hypothetical protein
MLNPLTGILELGFSPQDASYDEKSADIETSVRNLAALLHERHHWLQLVGTTSGMFSTLLLELQAALVGSFLPLTEITSAQLPILDAFSADDTLIQYWCRAETARRFVYGARPGDTSILLDRGFTPRWRELSEQLAQVVIAAVEGTAAEESVRKIWNADGPDVPSEPRQYPILKHAGWLAGARHLMECGARINESFKLIVELGQLRPGEPVDVGPMFTGVYGLIKDIFYEAHGSPSIGKEIALAYICDRSLNSLLPPILPFWPGLIERGSPMLFFLRCNEALRGFHFDQPIDLFEPESIDEYVRSISTHLFSTNLNPMLTLADGLKSAMLEHIEQEIRAVDIFVVEDKQLPRPTRRGSRHRFFLARCARAAKLRAEHPGFFAMPASMYLSDRKKFHQVFDQLQPPLVRYGEIGIATTSTDFGWLEFFLLSSIQYEMLRGIMFFDPRALAERLRPFVQTIGKREHGTMLVRHAIRITLGDSQLADALTDAVMSS